MGRLIVISGPSCVGKGPLHAALKRFYPTLVADLRTVVLYNSRAPRPGEQDGADYHFRRREQIEALRDREGLIVMDVRGDLQGLDVSELKGRLAEGDVFFEGNPFVGCVLLDIGREAGADMLTVFVSPLSRAEVEHLGDPARGIYLPDFVADVMRRKLLRRMTGQKGMLSERDLAEVERRASSAYSELQLAWRFDYVVPNHDGEDSENWSAFYYPLGDARRTMLAVAALLEGRIPDAAEVWPEGLPA